MNDLQKIVVLCFFGVLLLGGVVFVAPQFISFSTGADAPEPLQQIDPPSLPIDAVSSVPEEEPQDLPVVEDGKVIDSFDDCVAAGHPVMESYPAKCRANGVLFIQEIPEGEDGEIVACTADAKICPDGSAVGRVGPNCEFAACSADDSEDDAVHVCTEEERAAMICTMEYMPVCGLTEVQCITQPCDPVPQTYGNGCSACAAGSVVSYTAGACVE